MRKESLRQGQGTEAADHSSSSRISDPKINHGDKLIHRDHAFHWDNKGSSLLTINDELN